MVGSWVVLNVQLLLLHQGRYLLSETGIEKSAEKPGE
jgi:hypothetical protein